MPTYTYTNLPDDSYQTVPTGINDAGQIVGYYNDHSGNSHGFLFSAGTYTNLPDDSYQTVPTGINDAGQIVGYYNDHSGNSHGFLLTITPNPPVLSGLTNATFTEEGGPVALSSNLTVSDPDVLDLASATVQITGGTFVGDGDVLASITTGTNITASYDNTTETLTLSGSDTLAHYSQVLDAVTFTAGENPTNYGSNPTRTVTWTVNDGQASNNSSSATSTVSVTAVNDPPVLSGLTNASFNGGGAPVILAGNLTVSDPDDLDLASATVQITGGTFTNDADVLNALTTNTSITANYDSSTETLTLTGPDTLAHYQQVLESVTFTSSSPNPSHYGADLTRTVTWTVNDGQASNNTASAASTVSVTPAVPTLSTTPSSATVTLGPTPVTLTDTADLENGFNPTGSITFTLVQPGGSVVDTETVGVNGNGTYTTPTGFTLSSSGTAIGTYQWDATYSGDANNNSASDANNLTEQVTVVRPNPTITITTGGTTNIVDPLIAGFVDPADAIGSSIEVIVNNLSNAVVQQIQNIAVNAQGAFSSTLDLPTDGQYTAVAELTTSSGSTASSNAASYILNSTPNESYFGTNDAAEIARLYYGLLNRAPDPGGLQAFTNALENGAPLSQLVPYILGSAEYQTTAIGESNASFVQFLYSAALGRSPEPAGFQYWDNALNTGTLSRADEVNGVLASSEFQSDFAGQSDATYINEVYEVALQRPAEPLGLQGWGAALSNGMSRTTFDQLIVGSPEFQSSITEPAAASFVGTLYEQALGRAPEPQGLQYWTSALTTLNNFGVAIGIAESPEAQHFLSPLIEHGWQLV
jgi:probable HAF family extracellular repeat protein